MRGAVCGRRESEEKTHLRMDLSDLVGSLETAVFLFKYEGGRIKSI